jgi:biopolymer transport protein ExbD
MKHKRRLFERQKKSAGTDQVALQITSMADIFTILLVFLLKGLASDAMVISPTHGTTLPTGFPLASISEPALQVEVSKEGILIEKDFLVKAEDIQKSIRDGIIPALNEKLQRERDRQKIIAASNDTVKIDTRVILLSDETIPFSTMKVVLRTLSMQGYSDVKFAVVKNE